MGEKKARKNKDPLISRGFVKFVHQFINVSSLPHYAAVTLLLAELRSIQQSEKKKKMRVHGTQCNKTIGWASDELSCGTPKSS